MLEILNKVMPYVALAVFAGYILIPIYQVCYGIYLGIKKENAK